LSVPQGGQQRFDDNRLGGLPPGRFLIYPSGRVARVSDVFLARLVVRGRGDGASNRFRVGLGDGSLDLGELFGEALVVGAGGVKVGLGSLSADAQRVTGFLQGGDVGVGGGGELV
jgi:hypothetical protein